LNLDEVPDGTRLFLDSTIFVYHFTGASSACRRLLERCERAEVKGLTSVLVLAEVAHRLMTIEASAARRVPAGNVAKKLREKPDVVKTLHVYHEQVERIPLMGVEVLPVGLKDLLSSHEVRRKHGLLVNDSLVVAAAQIAGVRALASADSDFLALRELDVFAPDDLGEARVSR
jgi:predicted nucleic acid-binding protein